MSYIVKYSVVWKLLKLFKQFSLTHTHTLLSLSLSFLSRAHSLSLTRDTQPAASTLSMQSLRRLQRQRQRLMLAWRKRKHRGLRGETDMLATDMMEARRVWGQALQQHHQVLELQGPRSPWQDTLFASTSGNMRVQKLSKVCVLVCIVQTVTGFRVWGLGLRV